MRAGARHCTDVGKARQRLKSQATAAHPRSRTSALRRLAWRLGACLACCAPLWAAPAPPAGYDLVIVHGRIVDGTGSPWYSGDVGVRDGRIAAIGNLSARARKATIDAHGAVVAPGFIDMLGQSELSILVEPRLPSKIYPGDHHRDHRRGRLGRTSQLTRMAAADRERYEHYGVRPDWHTFAGVLRAARAPGHRHQLCKLRGRDARAAHGARQCRPRSQVPQNSDRCRRW